MKERVFIPNQEFLDKYQDAIKNNVKLSDFAASIGQAEQTVVQKVAKWNKMMKDYAPRFKSAGMEVPKLPYLQTGKTKGKPKMSANELLAMFGLKLDAPL